MNIKILRDILSMRSNQKYKKKVLILGGIGNGSVVANAIMDSYESGNSDLYVEGFLNDRVLVGKFIDQFPVLGKIEEVHRFLNTGYKVVNSIYRIRGNKERIRRIEDLKIPNENFVTFIHHSAYIGQNVKMGQGIVIMPNVSISPGVEIGNNSLIMVNSSIGHNTKIGECCHIAAQSAIGSFVVIKKGVHIGLNATIRENCVIDDFSTVGMGSVLLSNIEKEEVWVGNPARLLKSV